MVLSSDFVARRRFGIQLPAQRFLDACAEEVIYIILGLRSITGSVRNAAGASLPMMAWIRSESLSCGISY